MFPYANKVKPIFTLFTNGARFVPKKAYSALMATGSKPAPGALSQEIAAQLRAQIGRKQFTQAALADAVGISTAQMSGILAGKKHVDVEQLDELCFALGLNFREVVASADKATTQRFTKKDGWKAKRLQ